jgi:hypothetical protein
MGFVMAIVLSLVFPKKFESTDEEHIARANKINGIPSSQEGTGTATPTEGGGAGGEKDMEKNPDAIEPPSNPLPDTIVKTGNEIVDFLEASHIEPMDPAEVKKATRLAVGFNVLFLAVAILFVPFLLFGGEWIFPKKAFVGWCVVSFIWVWCSMIICVIWPVVESRRTIWMIMKGVVRDAGRGNKKRAAETERSEA